MENYKEKYKRALKIAKDYFEGKTKLYSNMDETLKYLFPELKESEDEKIRKEIIEYLNSKYEDPNAIRHDYDKWIAWLKKQECTSLVEEMKRRKELLLHEKEKAVSSTDRLSLGGRIAMLEELLVFANEKQGEQNSAWSEEDEKFFKTALWHISNSVSNGKDIEDHCATTEWLKSIKDRVSQHHWKPSEQNIKDLEWCADLVKDKMGVGFHRLQVFIDEIKKL